MGGVVAIGECMVELSRRSNDDWHMGYAGDTLNTAAYLARLGVATSYLTVLGTDPFSAEMRRRWEGEGIDLSLVLTDPARLPGLYAIELDDRGERRFHYWRERSAARTLLDHGGWPAAAARARGAALLYLTGITLSLFDEDSRARLIALAAAVRAAGGLVAFDPNYRSSGWSSAAAARDAIARVAPHVSIALPTYDDEEALHGDASPAAAAARWAEAGVAEIIVKLGANGCLLCTGDGAVRVAAQPVPLIVDTTGAGDAFNAGYLAARLNGRRPEAAAAAGNALAATVIGHRGAIVPAAAMPAG